MSSFVTGGAARASEPETETPKQLFVRMNGPVGQQLPPLQVLRTFFNRFGRVVKITPAKNGTIAFVTFLTAEKAKAALDAMNGSEVFDESNGASLVRTLFVDFALERGAKPAPRPTPRPAPAPRPSPRPNYVEPLRPAPPQKPFLNVESVDLPLVYFSPHQIPKMMSNQAMAILFELGLSPQTKFQGDTEVQIFGNGIQWVIPHPDHPYATQDCQRAYDSGHYFTQFPVKIPREVLTSEKFWRD